MKYTISLSDTDIKKLAELTVENDKINKDVGAFVLERLSNEDLRLYAKYLRRYIKQNTVMIKTPQELDLKTQQLLQNMFKGKTLKIGIDPSLGAGMIAQIEDDIVNLSFKNILKHTVEALKDNR